MDDRAPKLVPAFHPGVRHRHGRLRETGATPGSPSLTGGPWWNGAELQVEGQFGEGRGEEHRGLLRSTDPHLWVFAGFLDHLGSPVGRSGGVVAPKPMNLGSPLS